MAEKKGDLEPKHYKGEHLKLNVLKNKAQDTYTHKKYLSKSGDIPLFPGPGKYFPEFHVSRLQHDTHRFSLNGIKNDEGFKDLFIDDPDELPLVWFSLTVKEKEISSAERRLLERTFPKKTKDERQKSFLKEFASSPAFSEKSKYGSYRFTFTVEEVLKAYSEQFCAGEPPVMRVLRTTLNQQEVMYAVLVHSPQKNKRFLKYPKLPDDPDAVCAYKDGHFIWRPQAMCATHKYELTVKDNLMKAKSIEKQGDHESYVWDHVAIALHVEDLKEPSKVLKFGCDVLAENLTFCQEDDEIVAPKCYRLRSDCERLVRKLWNTPHFKLEEESSPE